MKDSHKKIGSVVLAGVMVAGGALQSGTLVANADGVNDRVKQTSSTMNDSEVEVYDVMSILEKNRTRWGEMWRPQLRQGSNRRNPAQKALSGNLNKPYRDKIEFIALGDKGIVDKVIADVKKQVEDASLNFEFDEKSDVYWYKDFENLKTGMHRYDDDRVVYKPGKVGNYGGIPIDKLPKNKFFRLIVGNYCHIFIYVKK